jgi:phage tail-like protein
MLINSKKHIPEVYSRERDMRVFTTLIDLIMTANKYDIDNLYRLYDASVCPQDFLPVLAETLNYKYDDANTITSNRKIIGLFMTMLRYKGCKIGLTMATALCLTSLDLSIQNIEAANVDTDYIDALSHLNIRYDYENGIIQIDYPNIYTQVRYLLDYVRPVGMYLRLRSVVPTYESAYGAVLAQAYLRVNPYNVRRSMVNTAMVNFSYPINDDMWNTLSDYMDENDNINLNN